MQSFYLFIIIFIIFIYICFYTSTFEHYYNYNYPFNYPTRYYNYIYNNRMYNYNFINSPLYPLTMPELFKYIPYYNNGMIYTSDGSYTIDQYSLLYPNYPIIYNIPSQGIDWLSLINNGIIKI